MATSPSSPSLAEAAELAFALLRFETGAAHTRFSKGLPRVRTLGTDAFMFLPVTRPVPRDQVAAYLCGCPAPAILAPTTTAGMVVLQLLNELQGDRLKWAQHTFENYRATLAGEARTHNLSADSPILLEFDDEVHVFSFATLCLTFERFIVQVAANLVPIQYDDPRARVRLLLYRSDGESSRGRSCPLRPRDP